MPYEHTEGGTVITGDAMNDYRRRWLQKGMELEYTIGMKLSAKLPSCFTVVRKEEGFKGNKRRIYEQFMDKHGYVPGPAMFKKLQEEDNARVPSVPVPGSDVRKLPKDRKAVVDKDQPVSRKGSRSGH